MKIKAYRSKLSGRYFQLMATSEGTSTYYDFVHEGDFMSEDVPASCPVNHMPDLFHINANPVFPFSDHKDEEVEEVFFELTQLPAKDGKCKFGVFRNLKPCAQIGHPTYGQYIFDTFAQAKAHANDSLGFFGPFPHDVPGLYEIADNDVIEIRTINP